MRAISHLLIISVLFLGGVTMLHSQEPVSSRDLLAPTLAAHAASLDKQASQIPEKSRAAIDKLAGWVSDRCRANKPAQIVVVCTGNSRRSMLGAVWGDIAADYYGLPVRCHSGGTAPSAFNPRTIQTLRAIGLKIEPAGGTPVNPRYTITWGSQASQSRVEFSKLYSDPSNPQNEFAAIMVCDEADAECPVIAGADLRVSAPFADPKEFDGTPEESARYDERRDDLGRFMLAVMHRAKSQLAE